EEKERYDLHRNCPDDKDYLAYLDPLFSALKKYVLPPCEGLDFGSGPTPVLAGMFTSAGYKMNLYDPFYSPNPLPLDKQFKFIASSEVVEHFYTPQDEFMRLWHMLQPGGWLGIMTQMVSDGLDFANWHYRREPTHVVFYSKKTFFWIAKHFGFGE